MAGIGRFVEVCWSSLLRNPGLISCPACYSPHLANNPGVYCGNPAWAGLSTFIIFAFNSTFKCHPQFLVIRSQPLMENLLIRLWKNWASSDSLDLSDNLYFFFYKYFPQNWDLFSIYIKPTNTCPVSQSLYRISFPLWFMPGKGKGTIECITLYSFIRKKLMDGQTSSGDTNDKVGVIQ